MLVQIITASPQMRRAVEMAERAAAAPPTSSLLITGETGTGKDLLAACVHERSGAVGALVTIDCAALCIKSGNAIVLRGSSYAERSNSALAALVREAVSGAGLPAEAVELLSGDRTELAELASAEGLVDLVIPRGGEGLKAAL